MNGHPLDHLVFAVPDLLAGIAAFTASTGVEPAVGGRHEHQGTANYLVGLGESAYLEIIGPDPDSLHPPRWFDLDQVVAPRLITWAVRPPDLDACVASARTAGYDPGPIATMSRRTGSGELLRWRLTPDTVHDSGGVVPFLIDWGDTPHPSRAGLPQLRLHSFSLLSNTPAQHRRQLTALGATAQLDPSTDTGLRCVLETPSGEIELH